MLTIKNLHARVEEKQIEKNINTVIQNVKTVKKETPAKSEKLTAKEKSAAKEIESKPVITPFPEGILEKSIRQKLVALFSLQVLDTQIDKIRTAFRSAGS